MNEELTDKDFESLYTEWSFGFSHYFGRYIGDFAFVDSQSIRELENLLFSCSELNQFVMLDAVRILKKEKDRFDLQLKKFPTSLNIKIGENYFPGVNKGNIAYEAFCGNISRMIKRGEIGLCSKKEIK